MQTIIDILAMIYPTGLKLRVGANLAQPSDVGEFKGSMAAKIASPFELHTRGYDLSHTDTVQLMDLIMSAVVSAGLERVEFELVRPG